MLRETELRLGVVASRTGLRDATYIVRQFRDRYGINCSGGAAASAHRRDSEGP